MEKINVLNIKGEKVSDAKLSETVWSIEPNDAVIYDALVLDRNNNVNIFINLVVESDIVIKDLSAELQNEIKDKVKKITDLEVKEVNITIKKAIQDKKDLK